MDILKAIFFWLWNSGGKPVRDSKGCIIPDIRRRWHSRQQDKKIKSGEIKLPYKGHKGPRVYMVDRNGEANFLQGGGIEE